MDADAIRALGPALLEYVDRFADCFPLRDTRAHFPRYFAGQLSDLERKRVEPMALKMNEFVARNAVNPEEVKYFISKAPLETPVETLLRVAFSRWRIEHCYEDQKGVVGLDHYEGRRYLGLKRHPNRLSRL